jgi:hypothetical protein
MLGVNLRTTVLKPEQEGLAHSMGQFICPETERFGLLPTVQPPRPVDVLQPPTSSTPSQSELGEEHEAVMQQHKERYRHDRGRVTGPGQRIVL